uniref:Uncharacterized protein n=1 Tax=Romanomermis culicivorax TaxID=13658 RepID=A0A915HUA9_ROMCU
MENLILDRNWFKFSLILRLIVAASSDHTILPRVAIDSCARWLYMKAHAINELEKDIQTI